MGFDFPSGGGGGGGSGAAAWAVVSDTGSDVATITQGSATIAIGSFSAARANYQEVATDTLWLVRLSAYLQIGTVTNGEDAPIFFNIPILEQITAVPVVDVPANGSQVGGIGFWEGTIAGITAGPGAILASNALTTDPTFALQGTDMDTLATPGALAESDEILMIATFFMGSGA